MKENIISEIEKLKKEKNAVILAHYYQCPEIQDIADYIGDSLALSIAAKDTSADIIVFCGVHFMAETAKIISPDKTVLLPAIDAGCPMADMIDSESVISYKQNNPGAKVMCYVNSPASVKAVSDICVTSTNAMKIAKQFKGEKLLYVPDQNLGEYLNNQVLGLELDLWPGHCCIHNNLKVSEVNDMKKKYPNAELIVHPEANPKVVELADFVGSTQALLNYAIASSSKQFIVGTEEGILHQMIQQTEDKQFILLSPRLHCKNMKKTTLEKVYYCLKNQSNEIVLDEDILNNASKAINLMLEMS